MVVPRYFPQTIPLRRFQLPRADRLRVHFNKMFNNTVLRTHAPFRSLTILFSLGTELTENQCQSVCQSLFLRLHTLSSI